MLSVSNNGSDSARALACMALWAMLATGVALPAEAAPFAYVVNEGDGTVSVIDTAANAVVTTVGVGSHPRGVAITPDGKRAYVTNAASNTVSVIDTATNRWWVSRSR